MANHNADVSETSVVVAPSVQARATIPAASSAMAALAAINTNLLETLFGFFISFHLAPVRQPE